MDASNAKKSKNQIKDSIAAKQSQHPIKKTTLTSTQGNRALATKTSPRKKEWVNTLQIPRSNCSDKKSSSRKIPIPPTRKLSRNKP